MAYLRYGPTKSFYLRLKLFEFDKIRAPLFFIQFKLVVFCQKITDYSQIARNNPGLFLDLIRQRRPFPKPTRQKGGHKKRPVAHRPTALFMSNVTLAKRNIGQTSCPATRRSKSALRFG